MLLPDIEDSNITTTATEEKQQKAGSRDKQQQSQPILSAGEELDLDWQTRNVFTASAKARIDASTDVLGE